MTEWPEIVNYDINKYKTLMKEPLVLDGRNCYSLKDAEKAEINYISVGRKKVLQKNK